jgi:hypothetical protein
VAMVVRSPLASELVTRILAFQRPKVNNRRPRQAMASGRCDTEAWSDLPKPEMCAARPNKARISDPHRRRSCAGGLDQGTQGSSGASVIKEFQA